MSNEKSESIFDNITDKDFENILKKYNIEHERVEDGQGGLYINGKRITADEINKDFVVNIFNIK